MAMEGSLLVSPEQLISTSNEFNRIMGQVSSSTVSMMDIVHALSNLWQGDAATAYKNKFDMLEEDMKRIKDMINEHVKDLSDMAKIYQDAENRNKDLSDTLAGDIIV